MSRVSSTTLLLVATLAGAVALGALWFPRSEDPGRSDAAGYHLNLLLTPRPGEANDWYGSPGVRYTTGGRALRMVSRSNGELYVLSRPLGIYADRCYAATVRVRVRGPAPARLAIMDERGERTLHALPLTNATLATDRLLFDSDGHRQISLAVFAHPTTVVTLAATTLLPASAADCPP